MVEEITGKKWDWFKTIGLVSAVIVMIATLAVGTWSFFEGIVNCLVAGIYAANRIIPGFIAVAIVAFTAISMTMFYGMGVNVILSYVGTAFFVCETLCVLWAFANVNKNVSLACALLLAFGCITMLDLLVITLCIIKEVHEK